MTDLEKLAELCEQATGPDEALDAAIWLTVAADTASVKVYEQGKALSQAEAAFRLSYMMDGVRYTASIDAAMTLVPEGCDFRLRRDYRGIRAIVWIEGRNVGFDAEAPTLALSLCAAALKARAASADRSPQGQDAEERLDAQHESAVPLAADAQKEPS